MKILHKKLDSTNKPAPFYIFKLHELMGFPLLWYFIIWSFIIALYSLQLINYPQISSSFYLTMLLSLIGILSGLVIAIYAVPLSDRKVRDQNKNNFRNEILKSSYKLKITFWLCCIIGFFGVILMYRAVFGQVSILQFFLEQSMVKSEVDRSWIGTYCSMAAFVAIPLGATLRWGAGKRVLYVLIPILLCFAYSASFLGRFPFMIGLIMLASAKGMSFLYAPFHVRCTKKIFIKIIPISALLILACFSLLSWTLHFRLQEYNRVGVYNPYDGLANRHAFDLMDTFSLYFGSPEAGIITYAYLANPIATLNYWVSQESEYGFGQASFPYFYRLAASLGLMDTPVITGDRSVTDLGLQLPTHLGYAYIDFGFFGVLLYSFLLSLIAAKFYLSFVNKPCLINCLFLPFIYMVILMSPMVFVFGVSEVMIIFVGLIIVSFAHKIKFKQRQPTTVKNIGIEC